MTEIQYRILDCLYFVESFAHLQEEVKVPVSILKDELISLIKQGYVDILAFDPERSDYVHCSIYDLHQLESYYFVATREGLMAHQAYQPRS